MDGSKAIAQEEDPDWVCFMVVTLMVRDRLEFGFTSRGGYSNIADNKHFVRDRHLSHLILVVSPEIQASGVELLKRRREEATLQ